MKPPPQKINLYTEKGKQEGEGEQMKGDLANKETKQDVAAQNRASKKAASAVSDEAEETKTKSDSSHRAGSVRSRDRNKEPLKINF